MISSVVDISNENFKRCGLSTRWLSIRLLAILLSGLSTLSKTLTAGSSVHRLLCSGFRCPWCLDSCLDCRLCTSWASEIVLLWTRLVPLGHLCPLLIIWNQLPW
ncbi:hypothetical protein TNIN_157621 [Trichonephila inaurata madagascariensis]|uniref:Uncharacterized protein n=1 Tax=Trichonephila inaurata madagascariensis TaxID=2747483 RepID=A0A8X7CNA4_9ARAC|nr:hypothetical protein TNIN_157621 [Trichonephila inaurata madagascariensis]